MKDGDFNKPIIAVVNSFTQFVPGHVHLKDLGQLVAREIEKAGGVAKEFNTIAVDDGIAMGHGRRRFPRGFCCALYRTPAHHLTSSQSAGRIAIRAC